MRILTVLLLTSCLATTAQAQHLSPQPKFTVASETPEGKAAIEKAKKHRKENTTPVKVVQDTTHPAGTVPLAGGGWVQQLPAPTTPTPTPAR